MVKDEAFQTHTVKKYDITYFQCLNNFKHTDICLFTYL